jgi:hypothetical protein
VKRDVEALIAFIDSKHKIPHEWGANDCMRFVAGTVEAQTGIDPARGLRWKSHATAISLLNKLGGIEAVLDSKFERIPPSLAKHGDIAGVPDADLGIHPMIVEGLTLVCPGDKGNARTRRSMMTCAWSAVKHV